jgi:hypothetical protein
LCVPTLHAGPHSFEVLPTGEDAPHLFGKGVISTPGDEAGGVFSPDGREFYFAQMNPTNTFRGSDFSAFRIGMAKIGVGPKHCLFLVRGLREFGYRWELERARQSGPTNQYAC